MDSRLMISDNYSISFKIVYSLSQTMHLEFHLEELKLSRLYLMMAFQGK